MWSFLEARIIYCGCAKVFRGLFRPYHRRGKLTGRSVYHVSPLDLILSFYRKVTVLKQTKSQMGTRLYSCRWLDSFQRGYIRTLRGFVHSVLHLWFRMFWIFFPNFLDGNFCKVKHSIGLIPANPTHYFVLWSLNLCPMSFVVVVFWGFFSWLSLGYYNTLWTYCYVFYFFKLYS